MKQQLAHRSRKELEEKMTTIFAERTRGLSMELQKILADDMVTAFENRLAVLNRAQSSISC